MATDTPEPAEATEGASGRAYEKVQIRPPNLDSGPAARAPARRPNIRTCLSRGLEAALSVSVEDVRKFQPSDTVLLVGEAILAGNATLAEIIKYSGLEERHVKATLNDPVAMAWLSAQCAALFQSRAAIVDAAVYLRAAGGDIQAAKLFYERMKIMENSQKFIHEHRHSGSIDLSKVSDSELQKILVEKMRMLPTALKQLEPPVEAEFEVKDGPK